MEKFLGVLFCGGRGTRLGEISRYVSKPLIPVYDRPAFMFGLELLHRSRLISDIIILTNSENDKALSKAGVPTLIQNDKHVHDMYTGWEFVKKKTRTKSHGVLVPSDNISEISADKLIRTFLRKRSDFLFSVSRNINRKKLKQMGTFDPVRKRFSYKPALPYSHGVIAPFIISNGLKFRDDKELFESGSSHFVEYEGIWNDIGDPESLYEAILWRRKSLK